MAMQMFATPARIGKFKGEILAHAVPVEVLAKGGRQVKFPKNSSDTYVARRWLPYGATAAQPDQFFANGAGDRGNAITAAHLTQEGVTPTPESITPQDVTVVMQQYSCLYGFTDKTYDLYEDDISAAMSEQVGERLSLVNELIIFGVLKACTNVFFGGAPAGSSRATVAGPITLGMIRKITKSLQANHGKEVSGMLAASDKFDTSAVSAGYFVYSHTDLEPDIRDLAGFTPVEKYATGTALPNEIGKCERFRFITSPELVSIQDAGAAVGSLNLNSTSGVNIDVYPFIVTAKDAWSQVAVRGKESMDPTLLLPGEKSKSDPFGQRGYAGTIWWKAVLIENNFWMAAGYVGTKVIS
jgi:N4-gp56 family major capsid protein